MSKVTAQTALPETSIFGHQPADWVVDRIRDHLDSVVGGEWGDDPDAHDEGTLIPVIRVADIRGLDIATEGLTVRRVRDSKLSGRIIGPRTVLLEKSGGGEQTPVGRAVRCRLLTVDAICSNFMAKLDCSPTLDPSYLVYLFDALYTSGVNGACIQQTTGIQNLRVLDYLNTKVGIPPLAEQARIAAFLDAQRTLLGRVFSSPSVNTNGGSQEGVLNRQMHALSLYQRSLIHECVSGQHRLPDAALATGHEYGQQ